MSLNKYTDKIPFFPKQKPQPLVPHLYQYKTRFSMLGVVGAGKTTICGAMGLTAQTLSAKFPDFRCRILETNSGILDAISMLRRGRFPPKTPSDLPYPPEAGFLLEYGGLLGNKKVQVPICDVAGEEIERMIQKYSGAMYPSQEAYTQISQVIRYVQDSDGFILVAPASQALIFDDDAQIGLEPGDKVVDPDVPVARILNSVFNYKEESGGKQIKGIAVVITKWDLLMPYAQKRNLDVYTPNGLSNFMNTCFPATMMALKSYGMNKIQFFPSYINCERNQDGSIAKWNDGSFKIAKYAREQRMIEYAEDSYCRLFEWLKSFAS